MNEKKAPFFLRWPWNLVIYILLALVLRIFAIPIIALMVWAGHKYDPHGVKAGICLSRTRKRTVGLAWALLALAIGGALAAGFFIGLGQDRATWDKMDYVTLAVCGVGGTLFLFLAVYAAYTSIRDAFFPARSALAQSIRSQLPYPDEAPPVDELFAMVDGDLTEHGRWFGPAGIGQEWVLGDLATRIDRIRGIFTVDEIHQHHTKTGVRTSRTLELVLIDDRWQRNAVTFQDPQDMRAAADCLALRVPDARRGTNGQASDFWAMDESSREEFEREFQQKKAHRASEQAQREFSGNVAQDMILKRQGGEVTSRVDGALVEEQLRRCLAGEEPGFELTPTRPVEAQGRTFRSLDCLVQPEAGEEARVLLLLELAPSQDERDLALALAASPRQAGEILQGWLRHQVPDLTDWELRRVYDVSAQDRPAPSSRPSHARLSLVYASGAAENHATFTQEDVQLAAEGIVDGTYQIVDLTHSVGYLWIRVTAGDRTDGRCTVEATRPGGPELEFYTAKMTAREAAAWLTGYPHGQYLPGGRDWKRVKKPK